MTMRRRLAITAFAATSMVVIAFVTPLCYLVLRIAEDRAINAATAEARVLGPLITTGGLSASREAIASAVADQGTPITVVLAGGRTLGSTEPVEPSALALARTGSAFTRSGSSGVDIYQPVVGPKGSTAVVIVRVSNSRLRSGVVEAWGILVSLGIVLSAGAVLLSDRIARRATRALAEVAEAATHLSQGDEDARAPISGPPEVQSVARSLNQLADRVDELRRDDREHLADLSHGLRTPITALSLEIELLTNKEDRTRLGRSIDRLESAVSALITSARAGRQPATEVDLVAALRSRLAFWSIALQQQNRTIGTNLPTHPIWVKRGPLAFEVAIDAVVSNAVRYTPPGTPIDIALVRSERTASLYIDDAGPGFASASVVERGVRGTRDVAAGGTGLGLDIARRVATDAGGSIEIGRSPLGGARVTFHIPTVDRRAPGA